MKFHRRHWRRLIPAVTLALAATMARADINGFGDFSQFTINQNDPGSPPTVPSPGAIELTNGTNETRSIFANTPQNISQFTISFTYQATHVNTFGTNPGAALVLENDPSGASAVGSSADNVYGFEGIAKSVGVTFDLATNATGLFTDGSVTGGAANVSPVSLISGDPINIQLVYSGSTLTENLFDTITSASFSTTDLVLTSIPTTVGGSTAFVGLTAGSPGDADEFFSNFQFTSSVPEPASCGLLGISATAALMRRRKV
jgi:hypothetical protein